MVMLEICTLTIFDPNIIICPSKIMKFVFLTLESGFSVYYLSKADIRTCLFLVSLTLFLVFYVLNILETVTKIIYQDQVQHAKYKKLVDILRGTLILVDKDLNITFINKSFLGKPIEEYLGKNLKDFPFYNEKCTNSIKEYKEVQTYHWDDSDHFFQIDVTIMESLHSNNEIALLFHDISSSKKLERQERTAALRAKNEFIASISHEIRNPLQIILYNVENLLSKTLSIEYEQIILEIYRTTKFLTSIIGDILDYSKIEAGEMKVKKSKFNLLKLVETAMSMNSERCFEKGLKMTLDFDCCLPKYFFGDPLRILQIMNNFISNAIKYTKTGKISISTNYKKDENVQEFCFHCSDTGIGIPEDQLEILFDPFIQVEESVSSPTKFKGWGLGLAICKKLLDVMGGKYGVESILDKGTKFWFKIPIELEDNETLGNEIKKLQWRTKTVSIVHSDFDIIDEIIRILKVMEIVVVDFNSSNLSKHQLIFVEKNLLNLIPNTVKKENIVIVDNHGFKDYKILKYPILPTNLINLLLKPTEKIKIEKKLEWKDNLRILIVDDSLLIVKSLKRLLQTLDIKDIETAKDGKEAFEIVNENKDPFDVILMDISMPVMDGIESAALIRSLSDKKKANTSIFALTGNALSKPKEELLKEWKMDEVIPKPVNKKDLLGLLNRFKKQTEPISQ